MATLTVPYRTGELTAIASRNGTESGRTTLRTVGAPVALRLTSDVPELTTGRDDLAHVLVEVVDGRGEVVPDAVVDVAFQVSGAGDLLAVGNGTRQLPPIAPARPPASARWRISVWRVSTITA
jgi:beta-galactosidase